MARYFYLVTALPDLAIGLAPDLSLEELTFLLKANLTDFDMKQVSVLRSYFDIENIRSFWSGYPLNRLGNFDELTLEEALVGRTGLPSYVYDYMDRFESKEQRLLHFSSLFSTFFREEIKHSKGALHQLLQFEREERLILAAFRAKKLGCPIEQELQFEDPEDPLVAEILAQKDAKVYIPPERHQELASIFNKHEEDPLALQKALLEYRFKKSGEQIGLKFFTFEYVLTYVFQWILAEKWVLLNQAKGKKIINSIIQDVA